MLNPQSKTFLRLPCLLKLPVIYSQWLLTAYRYKFNGERGGKVRSPNSHFNYKMPTLFSRAALVSRKPICLLS